MNYPIKERNEMLKSFFDNLGYNTKIIGDKNQPKIIINNTFVVSGFVKNKLFNFTTKPFGGHVVLTINLNYTNEITKSKIDKIFDENKQRSFFKIKLNVDDEIYYLKTEDNIPLFSKNDSRYFFDKIKANDTYKYLKNQNLDVILEKFEK